MRRKRLTRAVRWLRSRGCDVVMDGMHNSVTLSEGLYRHIMGVERQDMHIHVFRAGDSGLYCFAFREDFEALRSARIESSELQYNARYRKIGFCPVPPNAAGILSDYGLSIEKPVRLSVLPRKTANGETFYEIQKPRGPQDGKI